MKYVYVAMQLISEDEDMEYFSHVYEMKDKFNFGNWYSQMILAMPEYLIIPIFIREITRKEALLIKKANESKQVMNDTTN